MNTLHTVECGAAGTRGTKEVHARDGGKQSAAVTAVERPPLGAANTASTSQCSNIASSEEAQVLVGGADTNADLSGKEHTLIYVSSQQPFKAEGCQPSNRVGIHEA